MPKQCQEPNCNNDVFSHDYCKWHQTSRTDERWLKQSKKKQKQCFIKPIADKQRQKLKIYEHGKRDKEKQLKASSQWNCIFCGDSFHDDDRPDWHHLLGRDGDLVSDMRYIFPAHTHCHIVIYHWGSYELLSSQRWYGKFLERLKMIDVKLYNKELRRKDKS